MQFSPTTTVAGDLDLDLDLYGCSYDFWEPDVEFTVPSPYYDATNGPANFLFQNQSDGTFKNPTAVVGLNANNDRFSFSPAWGDYDNDGDLDFYVGNMWSSTGKRITGNARFSEVASGDEAASFRRHDSLIKTSKRARDSVLRQPFASSPPHRETGPPGPKANTANRRQG